MNNDPNENRIILIDKPAGISSFGVVAKVRYYLKNTYGHKIKVGHTGTLDPFATGLLILLTGKMTKNSNDFLKLDKVYEATLKLGYTSTTGDPEGDIQPYITANPDLTNQESNHKTSQPQPSTNPQLPTKLQSQTGIKPPTKSLVESILNSFIGTISQTPPKFSAIKINGQRAYKLARKNQAFNLPTRQVTIYNIELLDYHYPDLKIRAKVSSGTYIRSLAEDIGKKLETGAYLTSLRRLKIDHYSVSDAEPLSNYII